MNKDNFNELLLQALETEIGGIAVYTHAIEAAQNDDLKEEWQEYLEQTQEHQRILTDVCEKLGVDPNLETPGREVVRHTGESLVQAIRMALKSGPPEAAELVAGECVVHAETKDHLNWTLFEIASEHADAKTKKVLREALEEVKEEEAEHLFHSQGWTRELWLDHLGVPAALPPPEEEKDVKTKIGAGRAEKARSQYTD